MADCTRLPQGMILGSTTLTAAAPVGTLKFDDTKRVFVRSDNASSASYPVAGIAVVADPGNAGAIPVAQSGSVALVTGGAETRTIAAPTFLGQSLQLYFQTDGGNCVVTVAAAFNVAGNTILTFADANDSVKLEAFAVTGAGALAWRLTHNDGVAVS